MREGYGTCLVCVHVCVSVCLLLDISLRVTVQAINHTIHSLADEG